MKRFSKDQLGYYLIAFAAILLIAFAVSVKASQLGASILFAIILFIIIVILLVGAYYIFIDFLETVFSPYIFRKLRQRSDALLQLEQSEPPPIDINKQIQSSEPILSGTSPLSICQEYTKIVLGSYLSSDDLSRLDRYLEIYTEQLEYNEIEPIRTRGLKTLDLYHFGWSVWNYMRDKWEVENGKYQGKDQLRIAEWLQCVFAQFEKVDPETIQKKLATEGKSLIPKNLDLTEMVIKNRTVVETR